MRPWLSVTRTLRGERAAMLSSPIRLKRSALCFTRQTNRQPEEEVRATGTLAPSPNAPATHFQCHLVRRSPKEIHRRPLVRTSGAPSRAASAVRSSCCSCDSRSRASGLHPNVSATNSQTASAARSPRSSVSRKYVFRSDSIGRKNKLLFCTGCYSRFDPVVQTRAKSPRIQKQETRSCVKRNLSS
jgi:hypothetical protein